MVSYFFLPPLPLSLYMRFFFSNRYFAADNLQALMGRLCSCRTRGLMNMRKVTKPNTTQMMFTM